MPSLQGTIKKFFPELFPRRFFFRFLLAQIAVICAFAIVFGMAFQDLLILLFAFFLVSIVFARSLFMPLSRLLRRIQSRSEIQPNPAELAEEEGEWFELESAFTRIRSDLRQGSNALLREREELSVLMASITDAILAVKVDGKFLFSNQRFHDLFGNPLRILHPPTLGETFRSPELLAAFQSALRDGLSQKLSLQLHVPGEEAQRYFSVSVTPLRGAADGIYGAVGVFHDVTELKKAERVRIDFVANVSHELRTPLTAIKGYTDTLVGDTRAGRHDSLEKFLGIISQNVDRLMALVEDLLDLSSLESGVELDKASVSTREVTQRVLGQLETRAAAKNLSLEARYEAAEAEADPRRIEQVLINLIENAIKYTPPGSKIQVRWTPEPHGVSLRVIDNGPGIPLEAQQRLFERFYRVDKARSRELGGTGLGLSIVKHVMQRHGGSITVRSESTGSEFICFFPKES